MKITKALDKKVGDVIYYKYKINLPKKIEETDLLDKELNVRLENNRITIEKYSNKEYKKNLTDKEKKIRKELLKIMDIK